MKKLNTLLLTESIESTRQSNVLIRDKMAKFCEELGFEVEVAFNGNGLCLSNGGRRIFYLGVKINTRQWYLGHHNYFITEEIISEVDYGFKFEKGLIKNKIKELTDAEMVG